ncbi:MAG: 3-isopropylmalate dehydratase small subunit [Betaproteobacteria bacterium]|jgi:3-isopropylmalate/(R)-2-methylmalate dehydratase small subunit|nr:3-isopropylmalate dehydratase small subunit [Betaproteobacteria bacterium]MDH4293385.1 3-isopropylmalate dehydratase small subunit [Betaproteobacteria bacterium]MDH5343926.1 3-isopropylmalate dehydratase small subunit [Betaproteobacteria bacterium]
MKPFTTLNAVAVPFDMANIDTDRIIPVRFLRKLRNDKAGYDPYLFHDMRFDADGREKPEFVLNQPAYRNAGILVAGANFGCGSSREGAVYALLDYGIRAVIAPSFGDIHYANELQNGMLPVTLPEEICRGLRQQLQAQPGATLAIDLPAQTVTDTLGDAHPFMIDPVYKERLLKGLDDIGLVMEQLPTIETFEQAYHAQRPWLA